MRNTAHTEGESLVSLWRLHTYARSALRGCLCSVQIARPLGSHLLTLTLTGHCRHPTAWAMVP